MRRTLAARDAEIEVLKAALLDAEEKPSNASLNCEGTESTLSD
jgi:hypothetical protein